MFKTPLFNTLSSPRLWLTLKNSKLKMLKEPKLALKVEVTAVKKEKFIYLIERDAYEKL